MSVPSERKILDYTRKWTCDNCKCKFTRRVVLFSHSTSLSGETRPSCPDCGKLCYSADVPEKIAA